MTRGGCPQPVGCGQETVDAVALIKSLCWAIDPIDGDVDGNKPDEVTPQQPE